MNSFQDDQLPLKKLLITFTFKSHLEFTLLVIICIVLGFWLKTVELPGKEVSEASNTVVLGKKTTLRRYSKTEREEPIVFLVDLNKATKNELAMLPQIGSKLALRILDYRNENGNFTSVEDLTNIKGIGEKTLKKLSPYCCVSPGSQQAPKREVVTKETFSVNLNTALEDELIQIPHIGPSLAKKIVEFRKVNGKFKDLDDLLQINGVGEKTILQIKEFCTVGSPIAGIPHQQNDDNESIDLNLATQEELVKIPQIGPGFAQRIIEYRSKIGSFTNMDELLNVPGIGEKRLSIIKEYCYVIVSDPSAPSPPTCKNHN